ncbi:hypothetical protein D9758_005540 [Tetrapyrgos nigripes]|uniref:Major facilitator superfamily (MFS) profile domain-containing protein n=1 Tax=Tetrapyrgos nigripes TaxID=182062 RepID=A0A8H5LPF7_9AGAR|nr:hypothetical protein D9758_005540 [Tetrapyrgos nigripes]
MSAGLPQTATLDDEVTRVTEENVGKKEVDEAQVEENATTGADVYPGDNGSLRAWLVILGISFTTFGTFGFVNSWGSAQVFQAYYEETLLRDHSPSTIAWIGSVQYALIFLPGLVTGRLFDIGIFKIPFFLASVVLVVAIFLTAECKQYWHFLLCQGFAVGISCGVIFGPAMGLVGHWFRKRRGLALGVTAVGSSISGTVLPIASRRLIAQVGFPWTMRILGFIIMFVLSIPNITLRRRLPPKKVQGGLVNLAAFKSLAFTAYTASVLVAFLGLYTVLTYIDISATRAGISPDFSFYLISICNASSLFGRISAGILTDKLGAINFIAPFTLIAGVLTFAWPFAKTEGSLVAIAVLYGLCSGTYVSTFLMPIYEMGNVLDVGRRTGMVMTLGAIGALCGPPISGAINNATGGFEAVGYYAGSTVVLSVVLMLVARHAVLRRFIGKF